MARKLRLQYEGAIYHVTARGNERRRIFLTDSDRERFLWRLSESAQLYEVRIYLYCLMPNHFHLLVETPRANISRFMQSLLTGYTVYFNLKHRRCGHLLQGRYGAQLVKGDEYLLRLSRYIHLNPVRTRQAKGWTLQQKRQWLRAYRWSSYRGYIDANRSGGLVDHAPVLALMHGKKKDRPLRYRTYVEAGLTSSDKELEELLKEQTRAIGGQDFRKWVDDEYERLRDGMESKEDVSFRRESHLADAGTIVAEVAGEFMVCQAEMMKQMRGTWVRPVAAYLLCKHAGMSQRESGNRLGYRTGSAVSQQLKRLRHAVVEDKDLARRVRRLETRLTALLRQT